MTDDLSISLLIAGKAVREATKEAVYARSISEDEGEYARLSNVIAATKRCNEMLDGAIDELKATEVES